MQVKTYARFHLISCSDLIFLEGFLQEVLKRFHRDDIYPLINKYIVNDMKSIDDSFLNIKKFPGIAVFSIQDRSLRRYLERKFHSHSIRTYDPLNHFSFHIEDFFSLALYDKDPYMKKVYAFDFNQKHDDGLGINDIDCADVIIIGLSRTSKTPTCLYLANYGIKAANIPFTKNKKIQNIILEKSKKILTIALHNDIMANIGFREKRVLQGKGKYSTYVQDAYEEMRHALSFFRRNGIYCIDVTSRTIEDISQTIILILKKNAKKDNFWHK